MFFDSRERDSEIMSSKKYLVLNILLCLVILVFAVESYETWHDPTELLTDTGIAPGKSEIKNEDPPMSASTKEPMSLQSYHLISEKNIFSPERTDFTIPAAAVETQKPITRPQIMLYGLAIGEGYRSATVVNPGRPLREGERGTLKTLKIGGRIGEYTLARILPDRIIMEGNGDTFEVLLDDSKNPKRHVEPRPKGKPGMIAIVQTAPAPDSGNPPNSVPSRESLEKPPAQVHTRTAALPSGEYDLLHGRKPPSATIKGRRIFSRTPGPSPQGSVEK
jgi:type II secretory pathway component PulC